MAPPQAIPILGQMTDTSVQAPPLMVFWWVPYLVKRPRPDFNNGSGDNSDCGCILGPRHLFEFDLNNDPSPGNSILGSDGSTSVYLNLWSPKILIIHLMSAISGLRLDFNNCPCDNLNNRPHFDPPAFICVRLK